MLQWICHLRPSHLSWENPEDIPFTNAVKKQFGRGTLTSLKSPLIVLCRPVLRVRTVITELGNLNAIGVIGSKAAGANWWHSSPMAR